MAQFDPAHKLTSLNEGGYTDDANDSGNWTGGKIGVGLLVGTNHGISAPVLSDYLKRPVTVADMKNLTADTAKAIYIKNYWNKIRGFEINDQNAANSIYDSAVNMGVGTAIKLAQRSLGIKETGVMDVLTLNTLNNKK